MLKGYAMLLGGIAWTLIHVWDWQLWRAGKASVLPWLNWPEQPPKQTDMNRAIYGMGAIGNAVLGLVVALIGSVVVASL